MAKQPKQTKAPELANASATAAGAHATDATLAEVKKFGKPAGDKDVFTRVLGADGKGVPPTELNDKKERVPLKIAPQAQTILNTIEAADKHTITRLDLVAKLPAAGLVTRQPVSRILGYYQKDLVDAGCITMTKITA